MWLFNWNGPENEKIKIYTTKYGNECTLYERKSLSEASKANINCKSVHSFILEAANLSEYKRRKGKIIIELQLIDKDNKLIMSSKNNYVLILSKLSKVAPFLSKNNKFKTIQLKEPSFNKGTIQSLQAILKIKTSLIGLQILTSFENAWTVLNYGVYLKSITFSSYPFQQQRTLPQFYKMNKLITLSLEKCSFEKDNMKFEEKKLFRTLRYCKTLSFFRYRYDKIRTRKSIKIAGNLNSNSFIHDENFQELFCLNFTASSCSFDIYIEGSFSQPLCKLYFTRIIPKIVKVKNYTISLDK